MVRFVKVKLSVKQCYQTGQFQLTKNGGKMPKFQCDILSNFQTLCRSSKSMKK